MITRLNYDVPTLLFELIALLYWQEHPYRAVEVPLHLDYLYDVNFALHLLPCLFKSAYLSTSFTLAAALAWHQTYQKVQPIAVTSWFKLCGTLKAIVTATTI